MPSAWINRLRHGLHRLFVLWDSLQVDLHGRYTANRFRRYAAYAKTTSLMRVALLCIISPIPCITFIILLDSVKIELPSSKAWEMPRYWIRGTLVTLVVSICNMEQFRYQKPQYKLPHGVIVLISAVATGMGILLAFVLSCYVANPLPFANLTAAPLWLILLGGGLTFYLRNDLRNNPAAKKDLTQYWNVCVIQLQLPFVYPIYHFVFSSFHSTAQAAFVPVLSLMKLGLKNVLSRTLGDLDDIKPRIIILNVEVFHALFASYAMQSSSSSLTAVMLIVSDFIHACVSLYDVNKLLTQISTLTNSLQHGSGMKVTSDMSVLNIALLVIEEDPYAHLTQIAPSSNTVASLQTVGPSFRIGPSERWLSGQPRASSRDYARTKSSNSNPTVRASKERRILLRKTLQLFYLTEFIVLIEFVEIIIPTIYCTYLNVMFRLPNQAYYPAIKSMDDEQLRPTAYTVTAYASFEIVSLILISVLLWRRLRVSVLHQLAFVLEEQWAVVQFHLVMWVAHTVHSSLEHLGVDYSFKFAWVHVNNNTISL